VLTDRTGDFAAGRFDFVEVGAVPLTESRETVVVYELIRERTEYKSLAAV